MNKLLWLLWAFFFPHAEPGEPDPDTVDTTPADDAEPDEDTDADLDAADDAEPDDTADVPAPAARTRAPAAPDRAEEAIRVAREAAEAVARLTPRPVDATFEAEEARLRNPDTTELEKWQIQSNRGMRESQIQSRQALFQAQDTADRSMYAVKAATTPLYAKYEKAVEDELKVARSRGGNPPREMVLDLVVGRAIREGNFKAAKVKPTAIARGKTPGARSDTVARGGQSDREKRNARLAKTYI